MHNDIMAAGFKERPPMLALDTPEDGDNPRLLGYTEKETYANTGSENKKLIYVETEAVHMILNGIGNDIYFSNNFNQNSQDSSQLLSKLTIWIMSLITNSSTKQHQNEVNEIRAERLERNVNPLVLVATTQNSLDDYYQAPPTPKPYKPHAPSSRQTSTRSHATTRNKGKEIVKAPSPPSESGSEEDIDEEQAQRDKQIHKSLALIARNFKNIYKPTNNNLKTSSNTRNKNVDTSPRTRNESQTGQFGNHRVVPVNGNGETVGSQVVQQSRIQCFNCKGFGHFAKECRKAKRVKDYEYHTKKMLLCKKEAARIQLSVEQNSRPTYDVEPLEKVHPNDDYNVFATKRLYSKQPESITDTYMVETVDTNVIPDSSDMCYNEEKADQNAEEPEDELVLLASLIANLKLDFYKNKKI
ncbi:integrase, catalytic region, zinc finger, CCHC-type containing protein [Tanacetum coccineum]